MRKKITVKKALSLVAVVALLLTLIPGAMLTAHAQDIVKEAPLNQDEYTFTVPIDINITGDPFCGVTFYFHNSNEKALTVPTIRMGSGINGYASLYSLRRDNDTPDYSFGFWTGENRFSGAYTAAMTMTCVYTGTEPVVLTFSDMMVARRPASGGDTVGTAAPSPITTITVKREGAEPPFIAVTEITGVPTAATAGTPLTLSGTVVPDNATNQTITWSVKNAGSTGATITGSTFNATSAGTAVVTATVVNGNSATTDYAKDFNIVVSDPAPSFVPVADITGLPTAATAGTPLTLSGTVVPDNATNQTITWSVKNAGSTGATITGSTFNATSAGTAVVTATVVNGNSATTDYAKDFNIVVSEPAPSFVPVADITGLPTAATAGTPLTLSGTVAPANATNKDITWSLKNAGDTGAAVTGNTFNATSAGTAVVTATVVNGNSATTDYAKDFNIVVSEPAPSFVPVADITGLPTAATAGAPLALSGTVAPANATNKDITWSLKSAGDTGAAVTGSTFNAASAGTAVVTATIVNGNSATTDYTKDFNIVVSESAPPFVPVADITGVPNKAYTNIPLDLTGTVVPSDATNKTIVWSVDNAGSTGATISGNTLSATSAGTAVVKATIANGIVDGAYTQTFEVVVSQSVKVTFDLNGGTQTDNVELVQYIALGGNAIAPGVTRVNYRFDGWDKSFTNVQEDITVTAQWTYSGPPPFVAVTNITDVPDKAFTNIALDLTGTVVPDNATNRIIKWTISEADEGETNAVINDNTFTATATGAAIVTATVAHGASATTDYTEDFTIEVDQSFKVTFDLNGGSHTNDVALVQYVAPGGNAVAPGVTRANYRFDRWDESFTNVQKDITVTAQWTYIDRPPTTNGGGGTRYTPTTGGTTIINTNPPLESDPGLPPVDSPVGDGSSQVTGIGDGSVPLSDVPKTGVGGFAAIFALMGVSLTAMLSLRNSRRK